MHNDRTPPFAPPAIARSGWSDEHVHYLRGEKPLHEYLFEHAATVPERVAYVFYGAELTWADMAERVRRLAAYLQARSVGHGSRVALFMQNCP
jgi:long-chain acyl-CoA synthetase